MHRGLFFLLACAVTLPAFAQTAPPVTQLDPSLASIIAADAPVELAASGFGFTEGPVWMHSPKKGNKEGGYLLFTDVPGNTIWKLENGKASVFLLNAGYQGPDMYRYGGLSSNGLPKDDPRYEEFSMTGPDGLTRDRQNRLIIATFAGRQLVRIEKNGKRTVLADNYDGKKFSGPNDAVVRSDGAIYFTDTFGGLRLREKDPKVEIDHNALFLWKNGKVTELIKGEMPFYNGLAFSPDEKYLYLNGGATNDVHRYEVKADGTLTNGKQLFDMAPDKARGVADGMRVDSAGNIYETGPGGIWIVSPDGKHLGTITPPQTPINIGFGDKDMRTLYMASHTAIYKIRVKIPGL